MAKEDVVFLIDAKDHASKKLDLVKDRSGGLQKSAIKLGGTLNQLGLLQIPGLEFLARDFNAAKTSLESYTSAVNNGAESTALLRVGIYATAAIAGFKLIEYLTGARDALEKVSKQIDVTVKSYKDLAEAQVEAIGEKKFKAEFIQDPENRLQEIKSIRDELQGLRDDAIKESNRAGKAYKKVTDFHGEGFTKKFDETFNIRLANEGALKAAYEGSKEKVETYKNALNALNTEIARAEYKERIQEEQRHSDAVKASGDALTAQLTTTIHSERELLRLTLTTHNATEAEKERQLGLFDANEQSKQFKKSLEETAKANELLIDGLQRELDVLQLGADAAKLKEAAMKGVSAEALKEAEALQKQIAGLKDKEKIEKDLAAMKKRSEDDIARLEERLKEEAERGRGPIPILVAQESRLLSRGTGKDPASSTAENTQKMKEEIEKLRAEQKLAEEAAAALLKEIAKNSKPVPDKVLT